MNRSREASSVPSGSIDGAQHVVIAGAGIAGLALAIGLRKAGRSVTLVERQKDEGGSGLVLAPNGMKALAWLGDDVFDDVCARGSVSGGSANGHSSGFVTAAGKELARLSFDGMQATWGAPIVSVRRAHLKEVLARKATSLGADIAIAHAERFTQSDAGVELHLRTGEPVSGDVLVGADGLHSNVRAQLLADGEPSHRGYAAVRGVGPRPEAHPDGFIAYGKGAILFVSPVDERDAYWVASMRAPRGVWPSRTPEVAYQEVLDALRDWAPSLLDPVLAAVPSECIVGDIFDRDPCARWHDGRVVLVGDAAHPMVYTMGQGANMALESAVVLADQLGRARPIADAFRDYEAARVERTATVVKQSRMMGTIGHVENPLAVWARNRMMSLMMRTSDLDKQNAPVFSWTPPQAEPRSMPRSGSMPMSKGAVQ